MKKFVVQKYKCIWIQIFTRADWFRNKWGRGWSLGVYGMWVGVFVGGLEGGGVGDGSGGFFLFKILKTFLCLI